MLSLPFPRSRGARAVTGGLIASAAIAAGIQIASAGAGDPNTTTPIKHVVVLFQENTSFDHVFGTYPNAVNGPGEVPFTAAPGTPSIDGLTDTLLNHNPNGVNPKRLSPADVIPNIGCANSHAYSAEQKAFNGGAMDKFVQNTQGGGCGASGVLNYFDGNTYSELWNYAQHFAMSDHFRGTGFGPSTVGAIELASGDTTGAIDDAGSARGSDGSSVDNGTIYNNQDPYNDYDGCSSAGGYAMGGANIGDRLNAANVSWGWFQGGFDPTSRGAKSGTFPVAGKPVCGSGHKNIAGAVIPDYSPHHNPFAYYKSTWNPEHLPPTSGVPIGDPDPTGANHQYDTTVFDAAVAAGNLPAVSFVKAAQYQDGHPGYSDPIDEREYLVNKINEIEASPDWASTAIIIAWDDSDGWYDHQAPKIVRGSTSAEDAYSGPGQCQPTSGPAVPQSTGRCGFGPRLPFLVVSPYAKSNYVDTTDTDQSSIIRFIEDNWSTGRIGGNSADKDALPINGMFDFVGGGTNAALTLNAATGASPGVVASPTLAPLATPTPAPAATPTAKAGSPTPTVTPKPTLPPGLLGVTCKGKRSGSKKVVLSCSAKRSVAANTSVTASVLSVGKSKTTTLGTASATVKGSAKTKKVSFTITVRSSKAIKKGTYSLALAVTTIGCEPTSSTKKLKL